MRRLESRRAVRAVGWAAAAVLLVVADRSAPAQGLRYDSRRDVAIPEYATLRIGPFYSTAILGLSGSYRYTRGDGAGTDYYFDNRRGRIREDGSEFPMVASLDLRNYLLLTRNADVDASVRIAYRYFPMGTQEDDFYVTMLGEGVQANISANFRLTRYIVGTIYDRLDWATDYVDARGELDDTGGRHFETLQNRVGLELDWLMAKDRNLGLTLERLDYLVLDVDEDEINPADADELENQERVEYRESLFYEQRILEGIVVGGSVTFIQRDYEAPERADNSQINFNLFGRAREGAGIPLTEASTLTASVGGAVGRSGSRSEIEGSETVVDPITGVRRRRGEDDDVFVFTSDVALRTQLTRDLSHRLNYRRGLRGGFNSAFEEYDTYGYTIDWAREGFNIDLFTRYDTVEPTSDNVSAYDTWTSGIAINYPLFPFLVLDTSWTYELRDNNPTSAEGAPLDEREDYDTRRARIGTSFAIMRDVDFRVFVERVERTSDARDLNFTRDTFQATVSWRKQL